MADDFDPNKIGKPLNPQHPRSLGRYDMLRVLGQGGMGTVFLAKQQNLGRFVAVKLLGGARKVREDWIQRFELEIDALARLHHPNIVAILDRGEDDGRLFYVMEFVDGVPLRRFIRRPQKFQAIVRITFKVCLALEKVHHEHLVHRDLKPDNILIDRYGEVKLTDFGIVKTVQKPGEQDANQPMLTGQGAAIGTAAYMAPEQMFGRGEIGPPADVYAMGVMFHELLTGVRPEPDMPAVTAMIKGLPVWVDEFLNLTLHVDPKRRFANGEELKKFLTIHANKVKGHFPMVGVVPGLQASKGSGRQDIGKAARGKLPGGGQLPQSTREEPAADASASALGDFSVDLASALSGTGEKEESIQSAEPASTLGQSGGGGMTGRGGGVSTVQPPKGKRKTQAVPSGDEYLIDVAEEPAAADLSPLAPSAKDKVVGWCVRNCPRCKGKGKARRMLLSRPCKLCRAQGRVYRSRSDVRKLRASYWMAMFLTFAFAGGAGFLAAERMQGRITLDFFGQTTLPAILMAIAAAVYLIVLWALDASAQQNWQYTNLLPSGAVTWPASNSVRRLFLVTLVVLGIFAGGGVALAKFLPPDADPFNPNNNDRDPEPPSNYPPITEEQIVELGLDVPAAFRQVAQRDGIDKWDAHTANKATYWEFERQSDLAQMVFVPAGPADIGSREGAQTDDGNQVLPSEVPLITADLPGYFIDIHEVKAADYAAFLRALSLRGEIGVDEDSGVHFVYRKSDEARLAYDVREMLEKRPAHLLRYYDIEESPNTSIVPRASQVDHLAGIVLETDSGNWVEADAGGGLPMIFVTWHGAQAYAKHHGGRLPTELEWEKAARGPHPGENQYPWGKLFRNFANTASLWADRSLTEGALNEWRKDPKNAMKLVLEPVSGSRRVQDDISHYRVRQLAGNVSEWCFNNGPPDLYKNLEKLAQADRATSDYMREPADGQMAAFRGGAYDEYSECARIRYRRRAVPEYASWKIGFRVVIPLPAKPANSGASDTGTGSSD